MKILGKKFWVALVLFGLIGQVLIPGVIGSEIGAYVLRDAAKIQNQDGTFSFLPNANIWMAAMVTGVFVLAALLGVYGLQRRER